MGVLVGTGVEVGKGVGVDLERIGMLVKLQASSSTQSMNNKSVHRIERFIAAILV
jgi:hypothetical protein